jgi:hypothetical protein
VKASLVLHLQKYEIDNIKPSRPSSLPEDRKSTTFCVRTSCSIQEKKLEARAKVAALRSKIVVEEEIIQQKSLLAKHEAHLEKLKMKQQLAEAEAENSQELLPTNLQDMVQSPKKSIVNMDSRVIHDNANPTPDIEAQDAPSSSKPINYNALQNNGRPTPVQDQQQLQSPSNDQLHPSPTMMPGTSQLYDTNRLVLEALSLHRLPKLEPKVFEGAELEFLRWE